MAGVYFHIPFCKRICAYCDFYRSAELKYMDSVIEAMHSELEEQSKYLNDKKIRTIYFGGGTPSLLPPRELQHLIDHTAKLYDCSGVSEVTVEANPDDITAEYVKELRCTDINRVSLGVQSFDDKELHFMNRRHTAEEASQAVKRLQDAGIGNITIDLIFGVDGFGEEILERSIQTALSLGVQHISAYHLTIECATAFYRRVQRGEMKEVDEECSEREYAIIEKRLCDAGYEHYEVSNYALKGFRSQHNSSYWSGAEYLGIGPGAHSFNGTERQWSSQSLSDYASKREYESEILTDKERYNEYVMTSLRRCEGVDAQYIKEHFGEQKYSKVISEAQRWIASGDLVLDGSRLKIPTSRFLVSDAVIESFFEV
ncbi:MAG: radical SAM family heme chaperone HemW [Alistipes sp.]|nr:radical SAM family heme chaperone HemW [Alistipes sp.]